jgi:hypothetical protein
VDAAAARLRKTAERETAAPAARELRRKDRREIIEFRRRIIPLPPF